MRSQIHEEKRQLSEDFELMKVKSIIAQECASLNEFQLENNFLHNELQSFKRITFPIKDKANASSNQDGGCKEIHDLQK
jgi:hypothetical protein